MIVTRREWIRMLRGMRELPYEIAAKKFDIAYHESLIKFARVADRKAIERAIESRRRELKKLMKEFEWVQSMTSCFDTPEEFARRMRDRLPKDPNEQVILRELALDDEKRRRRKERS